MLRTSFFLSFFFFFFESDNLKSRILSSDFSQERQPALSPKAVKLFKAILIDVLGALLIYFWCNLPGKENSVGMIV